MAEIESIEKAIAAINPDNYATQDRDQGVMDMSGFKKAVKKDFWKAAKDMKKYNLKPQAAVEHKLVYDSTSESLEPFYFWLLDKLEELGMLHAEKLIDNFSSSPGSGHFSELMAKGTKMQEEAMKILGTTNTVIKSIINIIYDLKEFEIRISQYKAASSKDANESEAGLLALKQIWMDNVDVKKGRGSINLLAQDLNFVTIRDAFMIVKTLEDIDKLDLNDRVKRILKPRLQEFLQWKELSGKEIVKRYEIEKRYLKSQVDALKLYTRWAKPYLRAAAQLEQKNSSNPGLVTAFNTIVLELTILGKRKATDFFNEAANKNLPEAFTKIKLKREYYACVFIDFVFRGIPQRVGPHYAFGGRAEAYFRAYALNEDEIKMMKEKLEDSDVNEALKLVEGMTEDSIKQMQEDLDYFLGKKEDEKKEDEDTNPFAALFSFKKKPAEGEEEKKEKKMEEIKPDNWEEKMVRQIAEDSAKSLCFNIFDIYKKGHNMASYPPNPYSDK